mmetsp:Transcript_5728/g.11862  ORF Transcript_5728/g.11862 Transcript_5728/m.11862 type:complete len:347 (-) Transcript_5728:133-1173(-)
MRGFAHLFAAVSSVDLSFEQFTVQFGKTYAGEEAEVRRANFQKSLQTIKAHNANPERSWTMGVNQFSDMSDEEFDKTVLMSPQHCSATNSVGVPNGAVADLPEHLDWREKGVVPEVKNQGSCGSCWTFSTVGALESHMAIKYDAWRAPRLSEQQLVDCAQAFDNHGCEGGLPSHAFEYIRYSGGLSTEFSYPYTAKDGPCRFNKTATPETHPFRPTSGGIGGEVPGGSMNITAGDEKAMQYYLATSGPVSVAYQVASDFRHYDHGVYSSTICNNTAMDVNHAVLAVGYGTDPESGMHYWTIKNSWDYTFGEEGFFKIEAFKNMCGISNCNSFPDLYGAGPAAAVVV